MNNRYVTVCKEIRGQMRTRQIPTQSWKHLVGKIGANGWKECIPTKSALQDFPELKEVKEKELVSESNTEQQLPKEKHTYEELMKWPMKELVTLGGIGMKKKEEIIQHILKTQ
jgi:hypothetical protein